jgi:hypothetical protein
MLDPPLSVSLPSPTATRFESPLAKLYQHHDGVEGAGGGQGGMGGRMRRLSMGAGARAMTMPAPVVSNEGASQVQIKDLMTMVEGLQASLARLEKRLEEKEGGGG